MSRIRNKNGIDRSACTDLPGDPPIENGVRSSSCFREKNRSIKIGTILIKMSFLLMTSTHAQPVNPATLSPVNAAFAAPTPEEIRQVAPALEQYRQGTLRELWQRPELSPRDRSVVTLAVLIARNQTIEMPYYFRAALDDGVKPSEISEIITHLAFYSGWGNAMAAVAVAKDVFRERGIGPDQLAAATPEHLLPLDRAAEERRAKAVQENTGSVSAGLVHFTGELLFKELWLRPALAPRDRSLVTVSALIASGQAAQITFHLNRAMDNGLTQAQAGEVLTHAAFYAGWPNAFTAVPVMKAVFESRGPAASDAH
jgi:4-carboxymuconolactone decarboxylase